MNLNVYITCVVAVVLLSIPALADSTATIRGGVYSWDTFEPLENAVVEVNSTPSQSMVAKYGVYSFELEPGDYLITASYYQNSTLLYFAEEPIKVKGEGSYVLDLLLLPVYSEELMDNYELKETSESSKDTENSSTLIQSVNNNSDAVNDPDVNNSSANVSIAEISEINGGSTSSTGYYFLAALVLSFFVAGGYNLKKHRSAEKTKSEIARLEKSQSETNKLEKSSLLEGKTEPETERFSTPVSIPEFSAKEPVLVNSPDERIEQKAEQDLSVELTEAQLSEKPEFMEKQTEIKEGQFILETESAFFKKETEEDKKTFAKEISLKDMSPQEASFEEPVKEPEPAKLPEQEAPVIKKNLPLPADLQEIMDIIRGQGGRITQKDLRSKLKYLKEKSV